MADHWDAPYMHTSKHARKRMKEMGVPRSEVKAAVMEPERLYPSNQGNPLQKVMVAVRGRVAVVYEESVSHDNRNVLRTIITVLWDGETSRYPKPEMTCNPVTEPVA